MFKTTLLSRSLMLAFGSTAALLAAGSVQAQQANGAQELQRVEVTGSGIRRTDTETASPVQIISKQEIDQSGKATVAEYLQTLTADSQGSVPFTYGRGFSGGTSSGISLRGLGANATLVLINGRRVATAVLADDAQRTYVDLNQIPLEAVERVEVLKDGGSSLYGSDAVAGVVNIILRKNFNGTVAKIQYGFAQHNGDGQEPRAAITHGFGDLSADGYNVLLNAELGKRDPIYYRDRVGRNGVGVSTIGQPQWGLDPNAGPSNNIPRQGGNGTIPVGSNGALLNNSAAASFVGNVRNPATLNYYSRTDAAGAGFTRTFPNAQAYCLANTNLPQNSAGGGCIFDARQLFSQVQPEQKTANFFGRFTKTITPDIEGFVEAGYYQSRSVVTGLPVSPSGAYFTSDGVAHSQTAATALGAAHPDNPYFGTPARLAYYPLEDGTSDTRSKSHSFRLVGGVKGTWNSIDFDTGITYSEARQTDTATNVLNWRVSNALLNPTAANVAAARANSPAYTALPVNTYWRIGENANLNSADMYNALLASKQREGYSKLYDFDFKASKPDVFQLPGGTLGFAAGVEIRREDNSLPLYDGLGDYTGLSFTTYGGARNIFATYAEADALFFKQLEVSAAVRYDHYTIGGNAVTPKAGVKWKALDSLALRATYSRAFRAPSSTENSASSFAAFGGSTVDDNARCAAGVPAASCRGIAPTFVQTGNPELQPEKSTSYTVGGVWDITPKTSAALDLWRIKRTGLPVLSDPQAAVDAGNVIRDTETRLTPTDPGGILVGYVNFVNSASSVTSGVDLDFKSRWDIGGGYGRLTGGVTWTHLFTQQVVDADGTVHNYAGTHGDCNITNCMGSPRDRIQLTGSWDWNQFRLSGVVNHRGGMSNKDEQSQEGCSQVQINGADFPSGCRVKSYTTLDMSTNYKFTKNFELFGSISNVFDSKPPLDFTTYGAIGYNPLDYEGAIGRFFRVGARYTF